ncbi:unnamed protein product, partial [Brachionus calyciflorus]
HHPSYFLLINFNQFSFTKKLSIIFKIKNNGDNSKV